MVILFNIWREDPFLVEVDEEFLMKENACFWKIRGEKGYPLQMSRTGVARYERIGSGETIVPQSAMSRRGCL